MPDHARFRCVSFLRIPYLIHCLRRNSQNMKALSGKALPRFSSESAVGWHDYLHLWRWIRIRHHSAYCLLLLNRTDGTHDDVFPFSYHPCGLRIWNTRYENSPATQSSTTPDDVWDYFYFCIVYHTTVIEHESHQGGRNKRVRTPIRRISHQNEGLKATLLWGAGPGPQGSDARHWSSCFLSEPANSVLGQESPLSFRNSQLICCISEPVSQSSDRPQFSPSVKRLENHPKEWKTVRPFRRHFEHPKMLLWVRIGFVDGSTRTGLSRSSKSEKPLWQYGWCLIPSDTVFSFFRKLYDCLRCCLTYI